MAPTTPFPALASLMKCNMSKQVLGNVSSLYCQRHCKSQQRWHEKLEIHLATPCKNSKSHKTAPLLQLNHSVGWVEPLRHSCLLSSDLKICHLLGSWSLLQDGGIFMSSSTQLSQSWSIWVSTQLSQSLRGVGASNQLAVPTFARNLACDIYVCRLDEISFRKEWFQYISMIRQLSQAVQKRKKLRRLRFARGLQVAPAWPPKASTFVQYPKH